MSEPTGTRPFAPFEWMLSLRYLRARRQEGFISVIAGFSFLGIMLGVATLIIVMAVMNGFRKELLDKILGLNGHLLVQPLESPLTDYEAVAERISKLDGIRLAVPIVEGQALASSPFNAAGVLVRGIRGDDLDELTSIAKNIKQGTLDGFDEGQGVVIGRRLADQLTLRAGDSVTLVAPRGAVTPMGTTPRIKVYKIAAVFEIGMSEYDAAFVFMPLTEAQAYFNRDGDVTAIEVYTDDPDKIVALPADGDRGRQAADLHDRLAAAQRHLLQRAAGRAQRDVPDPDADRAGGGAQHHLGPDHAGEGQGPRHRHPAHHGRDAGRDHAGVPDHRRGDRRGRHLVGFLLGLLVCLNIESIRQFMSWLTNTELFSPELYFLSRLPADLDVGETTAVVVMALALSLLATLYPSWRAARLDPVEALRYE